MKPFNVTIVVPSSLRSCVEGRAVLHFGVPPNATVGDILETLFRLYPRLVQHVASEEAGRGSLTVFDGAAPESGREIGRLRDGQRLFLSAQPPRSSLKGSAPADG